MELTNKSAIVTGAGRGIGRAIAIAFAREGATVVCCARSEEQLEETVSLIQAAGGKARAVTADVTVDADVRRILQEALDAANLLGVVFNNAGSNRSLGNLWEVPSETWWGDISTNLLGTYLVCREVVPVMNEQGSGVIINMVGGGFDKPFPGAAAYACSKSAVNRMTDTLAAELALAGSPVLVFGFGPGLVKTTLSQGHADAVRADGSKWAPGIQKMFDEGKDRSPEEVAEAAVHLVGIASKEHSGKLFQAPKRAFQT